MWMPEKPHKIGILQEVKTDMVISEVPSLEVYYDALVIPSNEKTTELDINLSRRHAQIQVALYFIGRQLNFRTWIAQNDKGIIYQNKKLGEFEGIITSFRHFPQIFAKIGIMRTLVDVNK